MADEEDELPLWSCFAKETCWVTSLERMGRMGLRGLRADEDGLKDGISVSKVQSKKVGEFQQTTVVCSWL